MNAFVYTFSMIPRVLLFTIVRGCENIDSDNKMHRIECFELQVLIAKLVAFFPVFVL